MIKYTAFILTFIFIACKEEPKKQEHTETSPPLARSVSSFASINNRATLPSSPIPEKQKMDDIIEATINDIIAADPLLRNETISTKTLLKDTLKKIFSENNGLATKTLSSTGTFPMQETLLKELNASINSKEKDDLIYLIRKDTSLSKTISDKLAVYLKKYSEGTLPENLNTSASQSSINDPEIKPVQISEAPPAINKKPWYKRMFGNK